MNRDYVMKQLNNMDKCKEYKEGSRGKVKQYMKRDQGKYILPKLFGQDVKYYNIIKIQNFQIFHILF